MSWVRRRLEYLRAWRDAVRAIVESVRELGIDAEVYVVGGAAEGRLTVLSDVDVLVCLRGRGLDVRRVKKAILFNAMDRHGLPWDYPIDLHVLDEAGCVEFLRMCRKPIRVA